MVTGPLAVLIRIFGLQSYPVAAHVLSWLFFAAFVVGFLWSNVGVYSDLRGELDEANRRLHALSVRLKQASADEYFSLEGDDPAPIQRALEIHLIVAIRNGDGQHSRTLEVEECTCDVPNASLRCVSFGVEAKSPRGIFNTPSPYKTVSGGEISDATLHAMFEILIWNTPIAAEVRGAVRLKDNSGTPFELPFDAVVRRNDPIHCKLW